MIEKRAILAAVLMGAVFLLGQLFLFPTPPATPPIEQVPKSAEAPATKKDAPTPPAPVVAPPIATPPAALRERPQQRLAVVESPLYRAVVSSAGGAVTSASATVSVNPVVVAPTITKQPLSLTLALGASATFTVEASGTDLVYQWFHEGRGLLAATTAILKTNIIGTYHVVVSNSAGQVQSRDVTLIAIPIPLLGSPQQSP